MRLLSLGSDGQLRLTKELVEGIPPYAILSHTWGADEDEVTFQDMENGSYKRKGPGYAKIQFCAQQAHKDGLQHFWIDTCCINKSSSTELSEAITSMFRWYAGAEKCYVYLSDISIRKRGSTGQELSLCESAFEQSRWFTRGWTLQELLAPKSVEFYSRDGDLLGNREELKMQIHKTTGIHLTALEGTPLSQFPVDERLGWSQKRETKRVEDKAYCLLGILNVSMSPRYGEGEKAFSRLVSKLNKPSEVTFDDVDLALRNYYHHHGRLAIERLSGHKLPIERCYINLCTVDNAHSFSAGDRSNTGETFSLWSRLNVEMPPESRQVTLETLFSPRQLPNGKNAQPNRILIWGRAGVGKSTLCKKVVHDFLHRGLWSGLYDRVLWVPLRRLKLMGYESTTMKEFLQQEYFMDEIKGQALAEMLQRAIMTDSDRTLFILDGLDEVSSALDGDSPMGRVLDKLLQHDKLIITSRPHSTPFVQHIHPDLVLDTVGFSPDQVQEYLQCEAEQERTSAQTISDIRSFLEKNPLVETLVRIPIQLDALCYAWTTKDFSKANATMTSLYVAITQHLLDKDIIRLDKKSKDGNRFTRQQIQSWPGSKHILRNEVEFVETLAFSGLYNETFEFGWDHIGSILELFDELPPNCLEHLSFLRSSENSSQRANQTYHFIHLTYQEFFAARYFVARWIDGSELQILTLKKGSARCAGKDHTITPVRLVSLEKYSARYNIFWRFVVGLLQDKDDHLHRLFDVLEDEPRDLLGPPHQRLILHCLSEVITTSRSFLSRVQRLEDVYAQWAIFETKACTTRLFPSSLMSEPECTDFILLRLLNSDDAIKLKTISKILSYRVFVSWAVLERIAWILENTSFRTSWVDSYKCLLKHHLQLPQDLTAKLEAFLLDDDKSIRLKALRSLSGVTSQPASFQKSLILLLRDEDIGIRFEATTLLSRWQNLSEEVISSQISQLYDEDAEVRYRAIEFLNGRRNLPEEAIQGLISRLRDEDDEVRQRATEVLGKRQNLPEEAIHGLISRLGDEEVKVRLSAQKYLGRRQNLPEEAIHGLISQLGDEDMEVRKSVMWCLGRRQNLPEEVIPGLMSQLSDEHEDEYLRTKAIEVLGFQPKLPRPLLQHIFSLREYTRVQREDLEIFWEQSDDSDAETWGYIRCLLLGSIMRSHSVTKLSSSPLPEAAVQALTIMLRYGSKGEADCADPAAEVLAAQTKLSEGSLQELSSISQDANPFLQCRAAKALLNEPRTAKRATEILLVLLHDQDPCVRVRATLALESFRSDLSERVSLALVSQLEDEEKAVRDCAAERLQARKNLPEAAIKQLTSLLLSGNQELRWLARMALSHPKLFGQITDHSIPSKTARFIGGQATPSDRTIHTVCVLLKNEENDEELADAIDSLSHIFGHQHALPAQVVDVLVRRLEYAYGSIRPSLFKVLRKSELFYSRIPNMGWHVLESLLGYWLELCFESSLKCILGQHDLSVTVDGVLYTVPLDESQRKRFQDISSEYFRRIGRPPVVASAGEERSFAS